MRSQGADQEQETRTSNRQEVEVIYLGDTRVRALEHAIKETGSDQGLRGKPASTRIIIINTQPERSQHESPGLKCPHQLMFRYRKIQ